MFKKKESKPQTVFFKPKPSQAQQLETSVSSINHVKAKKLQSYTNIPEPKLKGCWPFRCGR